jgi:holo-[acyl-carrier protein] synthase
MIHGVGTDIVAVARMRDLYSRYGSRLAARILSLEERLELDIASDPPRFLAKRFAAKEALAKSLGTGLRAPVSLANIGVAHDALGRPEFHFSPELRSWLSERGVLRTHLSISDEQTTAVAFVIAEC